MATDCKSERGTFISHRAPTRIGAAILALAAWGAAPAQCDPTLAYATYLGGTSDEADVLRALTVDTSGDAYVTGRINGGLCFADVQPGAVVVKLDPTGGVIYSYV